MRYFRIFFRRRHLKRYIILTVVLAIFIYAVTLLFGDLQSPTLGKLTELNRCPACYGVSLCPHLFSNRIQLEKQLFFSSFLNAKNIYYAQIKNGRRIVLKKLAHDWELRQFDVEICNVLNATGKCKSDGLLKIVDLDQRINSLVEFKPGRSQIKTRSSLTVCPNTLGITQLLQPLLNIPKSKENFKVLMANVWSMLKINPEPILLQLLRADKGWRVPTWAGACGRLSATAYAGEPLSSLPENMNWYHRAYIAQQILAAAKEFTFKHERYRVYLTDWSLDNIVVNEDNIVTFIDLEHIVLVDKFNLAGPKTPNWYEPHETYVMGSFSFSLEDLCSHHLSDHNIWAACYILAGPENPFLLPLPHGVDIAVELYLKECLEGPERFDALKELSSLLSNLTYEHFNRDKRYRL